MTPRRGNSLAFIRQVTQWLETTRYPNEVHRHGLSNSLRRQAREPTGRRLQQIQFAYASSSNNFSSRCNRRAIS